LGYNSGVFIGTPMVHGNGTDSILSGIRTVRIPSSARTMVLSSGTVVRKDDGPLTVPRYHGTTVIPCHVATVEKAPLTVHGPGSTCSFTNMPALSWLLPYITNNIRK